MKLISQISQTSRDIHAFNIASRDITKVRYLPHPSPGMIIRFWKFFTQVSNYLNEEKNSFRKSFFEQFVSEFCMKSL